MRRLSDVVEGRKKSRASREPSIDRVDQDTGLRLPEDLQLRDLSTPVVDVPLACRPHRVAFQHQVPPTPPPAISDRSLTACLRKFSFRVLRQVYRAQNACTENAVRAPSQGELRYFARKRLFHRAWAIRDENRRIGTNTT